LLNLPADALTKEMALTQQIMDLFTTYQVSAVVDACVDRWRMPLKGDGGLTVDTGRSDGV
jgi:hypothetical protein